MNILEALVKLRDDIKTWVSLNFEALNKKIDKKSRARFSRDYYDLYNAPQITEDDKKELSIADEQGNVIFKLDKDGAHTTNLTLNGEEAASQKYVQEAIESIDFPETDLTGYATEEFVEKAIENIDFPETDLTGYATEQYVDKKVADLVDSAPEALNTLGELAEAMGEHEDAYDALLETVGQKATREEVKDLEKALNNGVESDAEEYCIADKNGNMIFKVDKDGVETTAVKTKALTVDGKDLATHIQNAIDDIEFPETDLTGYATEEYVRNKIAEAQLEGEEIDLSGYATKEDIKNFITEIPDNYVEEEELQSALDEVTKELNEHLASEDEEFQIADSQGLVTFKVDKEGTTYAAILKIGQGAEEAATKKYVDEAIDKIEFPETDLSDYATKQNVEDAVLAHKQDTDIHITKEEREGWFDGKYDSLEGAPSIDEADDKTYSIADSEGNVIFKVDENGTHTTNLTINGEVATTKQYVDGAIKQAVDNIDIPEVDLSNHATKQYVDEAIDNIEFPVTDLTDYATKQYVEEQVGPKAAQTDLDLTNQELGKVKELVGTTSVEDQIEEALDNLETFSGDYEDLINAPDIAEDGSGDMAIVDKDGNIAFKVDSEGRTHVTSLAVGGENLESVLENKVTKGEITLTTLGITYGNTDLTPGVSPLPTGHFYFVYE